MPDARRKANPEKPASGTPAGSSVSRKRKVRRVFRHVRLVVYLALFLAVLTGVIVFVTYRDQINAQTVAELFAWLGSPFAGEDTASSSFFAYDDYMLTVCKDFQGGLALLSESRCVFIDRTGRQRFAADVTLKVPAMAVSQQTAIAYDRGGSSFLLSDGSRAVLSKEWENPIYLVNMNETGYYVVVSAQRGYKGVAAVYTPGQELIYTWYSAENYIIDAQLSPDAGYLLVLSAGQAGERFVSQVTLLDTAQNLDDLNTQAPPLRQTTPDVLPCAGHFFEDGGFCVLFEDHLAFFDADGAPRNNVPFGQQTLRQYDLNGRDFAVVLLARAANASRGTLYVLDASGTRAEQSLDELPESLSAGGEYIALLRGGTAALYDSRLSVLAETNRTSGADTLLTRRDKSVLLIGRSGTSVFRP